MSLIENLENQLLQLYAEKNSQIWISLVGPPGAGKSTVSSQLIKKLPNAIVIPMDGYHYTKEYLKTMPDPDLAFRRRGAEWTFDSERFVNDLKVSRENRSGLFPSFDHSLGDPLENDIELRPDHQFVILEGLYLLLPQPPWNQIKEIVDMSIFIDCLEETLKSRLIHRHMKAWNISAQEAEFRVLDNDLPNALVVIESKDRADIILTSE